MTDTIDLVSREEMERAVADARKSNKGINLTGTVIYLGIGCAVQSLMYDNITINQISTGDFRLIVVAHVFIWWAFLAYHSLKWVLLAAILVAAFIGIYWKSGNLKRRYYRWKHSMRWKRNIPGI